MISCSGYLTIVSFVFVSHLKQNKLIFEQTAKMVECSFSRAFAHSNNVLCHRLNWINLKHSANAIFHCLAGEKFGFVLLFVIDTNRIKSNWIKMKILKQSNWTRNCVCVFASAKRQTSYYNGRKMTYTKSKTKYRTH